MTTHLLTRRVRACLGYNMTLFDWIAHGWFLLTSHKYRASVRQLKWAFMKWDESDKDLMRATRDLRNGELE